MDVGRVVSAVSEETNAVTDDKENGETTDEVTVVLKALRELESNRDQAG